jgi:hypothetical protein
LNEATGSKGRKGLIDRHKVAETVRREARMNSEERALLLIKSERMKFKEQYLQW